MSGEVRLEERPIAGSSPEEIARLGLVHIPEGRGIFPSLGVEETLRLACAMAGRKRDNVLDLIEEMYEMFPPLQERRDQAAGTLSGGEQQMLAVARGLIMRPKLLMVDEMSQGLAPTIVEQLFEVLEGLPERGVSILIVEQFVGHALELASRAYVLEKGVVGYSGSADELAADDAFVKGSYLGDVEGVGAGGNGHERFVAARQDALKLPDELIKGIEEQAAKRGVNPAELVLKLLGEQLVSSEGKGGTDGG
jgi:branched-chain amino acid transport system ATP-binding protein